MIAVSRDEKNPAHFTLDRGTTEMTGAFIFDARVTRWRYIGKVLIPTLVSIVLLALGLGLAIGAMLAGLFWGFDIAVQLLP